MAEVIYESPRRGNSHPFWRITRQPEGCSNPMVVRFHRINDYRTLLDLNAAWTPNGWDARRWVPSTYKVPRTLLQLVETHMQKVAHG